MDTIKNLAPIVIFTYKRLETLIQTVNSLKAGYLAQHSVLIIFSDGAKHDSDQYLIDSIRNYIVTISGFKSVKVIKSKSNLGLANSIIKGVSEVLAEYKKAIILEDDLVCSLNFLEFMNQALDFYQENSNVLSISGYSPRVFGLENNQIYFSLRSSSWGWATWEDRWTNIDWDVKDYSQFLRDRKSQRNFNKMGSDLSSMLKKQMNGKLNSWAIRFCYHQFRKELYSVHPSISKIKNLGFADAYASNTIQKYVRFKSEFDTTNMRDFAFTKDIKLQRKIVSQFRQDNSILARIKSKIINFILVNKNLSTILQKQK